MQEGRNQNSFDLNVGDIEIGAVELKDAAADTRGSVIAPNSAAIAYYLGVQPARYLATPPTLTDTYSSPLLLGQKNQLLTQNFDGTTVQAIIATIQSAKEDISSVGGEIVVADNGAGSGVTKTLPIGGKYNATAPTYTDGDVVMAQFGSRGQLMMNITNGTDILDVLVQDAAFGTASKGLAVFGKYEVTPTTYTDGDAVPILLDANGRVVLSSDIEIGQVELKDADSTAEANIKAANTARTTATNVIAVQHIDAAGNVLNVDAANTARTTGTKVLPTQPIDAAGNVLGKDAANTARTTATLVSPSQIVDAAGNVINVTAANTARTTGTLTLPTQPIDAAGQVLGRDAANTARTTATLVNPTQHIGANGSPMPSGVAADPVYIKDASAGTDVVAVTATGALAINTTTAVAAEWKLLQVTCHFDIAPTTSQNFVLKLDNTTGAAYDTTLYSINPSLSSATDLVFTPDSELKFRSGDEVVATFTNTDARTYGLTIYYQLI